MWNRRLCWGILSALLCAALLTACGMGVGSGTGQKGTAQVRLSLKVDKGPAATTVTLHAANAGDLHQLSCRIAYNPLALRFVDSARGELVDSRAVFFTTAKGAGYVPVTFTYHSDEKIPAGSGSVATLHFQVIDTAADTGLRILQDEDMLIARDPAHRAVPVVVTGAAR